MIIGVGEIHITCPLMIPSQYWVNDGDIKTPTNLQLVAVNILRSTFSMQTLHILIVNWQQCHIESIYNRLIVNL